MSACLFTLFIATLSLPAAAPLADNSSSPHATVRSVGLDEARWTDGFWFDRFENLRTNMLPAMGRLMEGTNYSQYFENFRIAAGLVEGRPRGAPFNDGDFYKLLEAASATLAVTNDAFLTRHLERAIDVIAKAQRADGYIHTPVLIRARNGDTNAVPFRDRHNFEMYNMGHLFTAACVHHRVTGRTNFLAIARRAADFLDVTFGGASPASARSSVCPSHYMGMTELWRTTREPRYLALAKKFFRLRSQIADGGDDNQDRIPFELQTAAVGHAVRANYLYAGAADLFMETGDDSLWKPLGPIWTNVVQQKMHITGGCGALYDGASPDGSKEQKAITRVHQAYGRNYQLPNTTAHNETCANIGNVLWNWRMFLVTGEARFMDVAELALYNSVLAGVGLDGANFFYTNPLRVTDPLPIELRWSRMRVPFVSSFCCPPNVLRTIAESASYAYAKSADAVWVNLYGGSTLATTLPDGRKVSLTQETEYPWNGRVRITVNECDGKEFALKLRVPGWAKSASVRVNHQPLHQSQSLLTSAATGGYVAIQRAWKPGDVVDLDLPMPVRLMEAHPLVEETLNQVALQRGPLVYCLESKDLPAGVRVGDVRIPSDIDLVARYDGRLLGGVAVLEGVIQGREQPDWKGQLYRAFRPEPAKPVKVRFVPYSVWGNRGASEMSVWLPLATESTPTSTLSANTPPSGSKPQPTEEDEAAYRQAIEKRAADILALLEISDAAKTAKVHGLIVAQYRALRDWHDANDSKLKRATEDQAQKIKASLRAQHDQYVNALSVELTPAQVEKVKDKMTYFKVKVTYDAYVELLPNVTDKDKEKILGLLKEAREEAMDGGSAEEKSAVFNRYKGKINNYLSAEGYDLKQAQQDWGEKQKARKAAPAPQPVK